MTLDDDIFCIIFEQIASPLDNKIILYIIYIYIIIFINHNLYES